MSTKLIKGTAFLGLAFGAFSFLAACNNGGQPSSSSVEPEQKVVWSGVEDLNLDMGDPAPNLLLGVKAKQGDKDLTVKIDNESSDTVDTSVAGAFSIYYNAFNGEIQLPERLNGEYIRTVTVSRGVYIDNSDFKTSAKNGWSGNGNGNSQMTWDIDTTQEALVVNIVKSGDEYWQNQVEFNGLEVKAHTTYEVVVRAKSATPRNIGVTLEVPAEGYKNIDNVSVNSVGYEMSTEYQDFKYYYTASQNYNAVKFGILLGRFNEKDEGANTVTIDSVKINKVAKEANTSGIVFTGDANVTVNSFDEIATLPAVTAVNASGAAVTLTKEGAAQGVAYSDDLAKATFGELYKYTDAAGNLSYFRRQVNYVAPIPARLGTYGAVDSDFEFGLKFWNPEENGIVGITADKANRVIEIESVKAAPSGEADWRGQLQQNNNGGKLLANHTYKMVVEAKTTNKNVQTLRLEFCAPGGAGNPAPKSDMVFETNDTYQTFESVAFTPDHDVTGGDYRIGLLIGEYSEAYKLTVKSIDVIDVDAQRPTDEPYQTKNGEFVGGLAYWACEENGIVRITDNEDGTIKIASVKAAPSGEADWRGQLQQNNNGGKLAAGTSYKMVVKAKINNKNVNTLRLEFCAPGGAGNPTPKADMVFTANDTYQEFESTVFTPDHEVAGGDYRIGLLIGEYAEAYELTVDFVKLVVVEAN